MVINSIAGLLAPAMRTSYCGSKHALRGFFDSLRSEVNSQLITLMIIDCCLVVLSWQMIRFQLLLSILDMSRPMFPRMH